MNLLEAAKPALEALQSAVDHRKRFEVCANLRAAIEEAEAIPKIPKNELPERIYLQISDDPDDEWYGEVVWREVTWSHDNIHSNDLVFIRQDLIPVAHVAPEGWIRAIDEAMVCSHLGIANVSDTYEEAKKKLNSLICWNIDVATDPAVNGGWQLVPKEPTDAMLAAYNKVSEWLDSNKGTRYKIQAAYDKALGEPHYKAMLASAPKFGEKE